MVTENTISSQERLEKFIKAVATAQKLQEDILSYGLECADIYVEDVDGDWLEKWGEDEEKAQTLTYGPTLGSGSVVESVTAFLESDDLVAVKVRKKLVGRSEARRLSLRHASLRRSLPEIAAELAKCRSIPEEDDQRLFALKTVLADNITAVGNNCDTNDEISLLDLAEDLLEKLAEIWDNTV